MHDHRTGLQRGMLGPMICAVPGHTDAEDRVETKPEDSPTNTPTLTTETNADNTSINADTKGGKRNGKDQKKGYGQCWECGGVRASET